MWLPDSERYIATRAKTDKASLSHPAWVWLSLIRRISQLSRSLTWHDAHLVMCQSFIPICPSLFHPFSLIQLIKIQNYDKIKLVIQRAAVILSSNHYPRLQPDGNIHRREKCHRAETQKVTTNENGSARFFINDSSFKRDNRVFSGF